MERAAEVEVAVTDAAHRLEELVGAVAGGGGPVRLISDSGEQAVLVDPDELESLEETIFWLSEPGPLDHLARGLEDLRLGRTATAAEVRQSLELS